MSSVRSCLVVDDDISERVILSHTLQEAFPEISVSEAENVASAEQKCLSEEFDCIILDYNLPDMDGLTLARRLRAYHPYLPIILVTSVGDEMLATRALRGGVSDYIPKARINTDSIHRTVARAIYVAMQSKMIEEQRAELENFAYALAHDFKQPVRQIRTFTDLISHDLRDLDKDDVLRNLGFLSDAARRLGNLVDVMSQYTLLSKKPELGAVDLKQSFEETRSSLTAYIEERHGELEYDAGCVVLGNETLMLQVLQNLVSNGLKYNASKTPRVTISTSMTDGRCVVAVQDNGIGIEERYLGDIFKPLVRLHPSSEYSGSGLGLTLARKSAIAQGGRIWCASEPGEGSTFFIEFSTYASMGKTAGAQAGQGLSH